MDKSGSKSGTKLAKREAWRKTMRLVAEDRRKLSLKRDRLHELIRPRFEISQFTFYNALKGTVPSEWPALLKAFSEVFAQQFPESERRHRADDYYKKYFDAMGASFDNTSRDLDATKPSAGAIEERELAPAVSIEKQFHAAESCRADPRLYEYLRRESGTRKPMYLTKPHQMMQQVLNAGITIPIPVTVLTDAHRITLKGLEAAASDESAEQDDYVRMIYAMARARRPDAETVLWNDAVYTLQNLSISADGRICTLTGGLSDFFSTLSHHVALEFELLTAIHQRQTSTALRLPKRRRFFESDVMAQRRHAALSMTALVLYRTSSTNSYKVLLCKRSQDVAVYRGLFGIIPGGMFQPQVRPQEEWNIHHCLIKEFTEELFGCEFGRRQSDPFYFFYEHQDSKWRHAGELYRALTTGICKILYSGVILTLIDWLPQICCVLLIEDPAWYRRQSIRMANNFENVSTSEFIKSVRRVKSEFDFDDFETEFLNIVRPAATGPQISSRWVPASLASLWLGVKAAREHIYDRTREAAEFKPYLSELGLPDPH